MLSPELFTIMEAVRCGGEGGREGAGWDRGISFGTMPTISVVIPVHGVEDYLDRCLDSVLGPAGLPPPAAGPRFRSR